MGPIRDLIAAVRGKATNSGGNTNANTDNGPASTSATTSNTGGGRRRGGRQNRDKGKIFTPIRDGCWKRACVCARVVVSNASHLRRAIHAASVH